MSIDRTGNTHPFDSGGATGTPDRPCAACGLPDRDPIHVRGTSDAPTILRAVLDWYDDVIDESGRAIEPQCITDVREWAKANPVGETIRIRNVDCRTWRTVPGETHGPFTLHKSDGANFKWILSRAKTGGKIGEGPKGVCLRMIELLSPLNWNFDTINGPEFQALKQPCCEVFDRVPEFQHV